MGVCDCECVAVKAFGYESKPMERGPLLAVILGAAIVMSADLYYIQQAQLGQHAVCFERIATDSVVAQADGGRDGDMVCLDAPKATGGHEQQRNLRVLQDVHPSVGEERQRDGVLDLRTYTLVMTSLACGLATAVPAGFGVASLIAGNPITAGLFAGVGVFITTFLGTLTAVHNLIKR